MLYRLSYKASTGAGRGNLGSESRLIFKWYRYILREPRSTSEIGNYNFLLVCLGVGSRKYCRYTKSPMAINPLKEIWESPRVNENLTSVGVEPTTSGWDLPMLYRLSYEATHCLNYPSSSVRRALANLIRRSWVLTPPRSNFHWPLGTPKFPLKG